MTDQPIPVTSGIDHIGLSVRRLEETQRFFCECLDWKIIGGRPEYPAVFVSDDFTMVTLWQAEDPATAFDRRKNIGLHHLALAVADRAALDAVYKRVSAWPGVVTEFAPQLTSAGPKFHFMIFEPSGIRIEFSYDPRLEKVRVRS